MVYHYLHVTAGHSQVGQFVYYDLRESNKCGRVGPSPTLCSGNNLLDGDLVSSFNFDIIVHLPIHLVRHVKLCGPIANAWCYPVEKHLHVLKKYIKNKAHLEGAIANVYMYDKALRFLHQVLKIVSLTTRKIVVGSTQNQQRIVGCGCCFGNVGPVRLQQWVVDRFMLIWSQYFHCPDFHDKIVFFCVDSMAL